MTEAPLVCEMSARKCIFCDAKMTGKKSREHVLPLWMQRRWGLTDEGVLQTHFSSSGNVLSNRHHGLNNHVCGCVCAHCNNGWMSELEADVQPILIALAEGQGTLSALESVQRLTLARWACKTAYSLHAAANYRPIVAMEHYHWIRSNAQELPPRVCVHARLHQSTEPFAWWQAPQWWIAEEHVVTPDMVRVIRGKAYKICFSVKDLILLVSHNPFPDMLLALWRDNHIPVFPERGPYYWFERDGFPEDHTHRACIWLLGSMGLKQRQDAP